MQTTVEMKKNLEELHRKNPELARDLAVKAYLITQRALSQSAVKEGEPELETELSDAQILANLAKTVE